MSQRLIMQASVAASAARYLILNARCARHRHGGRALAAVRGLRELVERHSVGVDAVRREELGAVRLGDGGEQRGRTLPIGESQVR